MRNEIAFTAVSLALGPTLVALPANAATAGLNLGAPVWDGKVAEGALQATIATTTLYVRVNFRLDRWAAPGDKTRHDGRTFFDVYDHVVDAITSQGLMVYGLLSDELAPGFADLGGSAFEEEYARNALAVVDRYKDRVRVWETINEPNDFGGGTSARVPAAAFARLHARVYDDVKRAHAGDACWDVKLVTGPLLSFDDASSAGYLDEAIAAGRAGGRWKALRAALGQDPVDDVGYHLYVAQGSDSKTSDVAPRAAANLDAIGAVLAKYGLGTRRLWISEIGWTVSYVDAPTQAARLDAAFAGLGARSDVASVQWFTVQDFPDGSYGLFTAAGFSPAGARASHGRFVANARAYAPELAAKLEVSIPEKVAAGSRIVAKVKATNLGKNPWGGATRLGAASGCPAAWATNAWTWDTPGAGYVHGATDARVFLPQGVVVAQGASVTFDVPLTAPGAPGKIRFATRMVEEGVAWFGSTGIADVEITPATAATGAPNGSPSTGPTTTTTDPSATGQGQGGCGCRATTRPITGAAITIGALVYLAKRRRKGPRKRSSGE